ncbi:NAD(P)H-dependent glycerol-3-phosphate dehydrogenase [Bacillus toyonensis]|uniref:NAD(P)H-dependent glycerol-3-phosphate dehydrogenase n=1 Tax=Bacillus toyonensis TaxID=155322 RepID=UPI003019BB9A
MKKVTVLGAGSWGTALSIVLADNGYKVRLWGNKIEQIQEINEKHTNEMYLPGVYLSEKIKGYESLTDAMEETDTVLLVVPTKAIRIVMQEVKRRAKRPITFVHASKGIEPQSFKRISEIIEEEMPKELIESIVVLSGPSHAEEVSKRLPTTITAASSYLEGAEKVQEMFMNTNFRVYTNRDIIGVELGGALKNIIALGAGISDGLGYGDNARAALIARGLTEITRLGYMMGANPLTFTGLTGVGDLIVTCTSIHSRNWKAGNLLGKGYKLEEVLKNMGMVVEGVRTAEAAYQIAKKMNIEMPITNAIYNVLFNGRDAKEEVDKLMGRTGKGENSDAYITLI